LRYALEAAEEAALSFFFVPAKMTGRPMFALLIPKTCCEKLLLALQQG
jgi:hypothetical protein